MELRLNLARKPYLNRKRARFWLLLACGLLGILLALNLSYAYQNYQQMQVLDERFRELDAQVVSVQGAPDDFSPAAHAAVLADVALANLIIEGDQFRWTRLLDRLETLLPAEVIIQSLQPDFEKRSLQVSATARDVAAMSEFIDNLLQSTDLSQAFLMTHAAIDNQQTDGAGAKLVGFSLQIREAF